MWWIVLAVVPTTLLIAILIVVIVFVVRSFKDHNEELIRANIESGMSNSEINVAVLFERLLEAYPDDKKVLLNNLLLPGLYDLNKTTQIDTLVICPKGIFVIEVKGWHGTIRGSEDDDKWTIDYNNGDSHKNKNPVKQNSNHTKRVMDLIEQRLNMNSVALPIYNMVIFDEGDIRYLKSSNCYTPNQASSFVDTCVDQLSDPRLSNLINLFKDFKDNPVATNEEHNEYVNKLRKEHGDEDL